MFSSGAIVERVDEIQARFAGNNLKLHVVLFIQVSIITC